MKRNTTNIIIWTLFSFLVMASLAFSSDTSAFPEDVSDISQEKALKVSLQSSSEESLQKMLALMVQNEFSLENQIRAQEVVGQNAVERLPTEPVISKALEGMAKNKDQETVISAMEKVRTRYALARRISQSIVSNPENIPEMTQVIADSLVAGMKSQDVEKLAARLRVQNRAQIQMRNIEQEDQLSLQTFQTVRTMARFSVQSSDISALVSQALASRYTHREMKQFRHEFAKRAKTVSARQVAVQMGSQVNRADNSGGGNGGGGNGGGGNGGGGNGGGGNGGGGNGGGGNGGGGNGGGGNGGGGNGGGGNGGGRR